MLGLGDRAECAGGRTDWRPVWREPAPKPATTPSIIGGGGHGLSTAYYLARNHGITNVAVLEKGYLGGGNVGRNTTIVRANYFLPGNSEFYSHSLKLWEGLEQELNYNVMHSQRGLHEPVPLGRAEGRLRAARQRHARAGGRRGAPRPRGGAGDAALPRLRAARFPIHGGLFHPRGGTARHDAVAWGYARGADRARAWT